MRSSKSRSRSKPNRPRNIGNIINRVFDSSGPEGKVRGTPQQIIEKYQLLARDAQLSNDRVAAENFQQHAEHYTRMLSEAQRELAAEQEARAAQQGQQQQRQNGDRFERREDRGDYRPYNRDNDSEEQPPMAAFEAEPAAFRMAEDEAGLVETPEARPVQAERQDRGDRNDRSQDRGNRNERNRNDGHRNEGQRNDNNRGEGGDRRPPREPRPPRPERVEEAPTLPLEGGETAAPVVADAPKADRPRRAPKPRKPAEPKADGGDGPLEAAE
ncbi:DUF4167 domain-containing protein [Neogemmobacter tilapiae]|uniref:DUF4167 domain-containing protein n=1 Tax=Neogemmobacter tilapiae TaxID=875041 RepID=A0A918WH28_9RHOB|nr:DUF4167 domain-containing protein [Gemmobacter tilapiae]GHC45839.1 hypothetical protein GCM10007315_04250 [Gemmobacter tilapiae]